MTTTPIVGAILLLALSIGAADLGRNGLAGFLMALATGLAGFVMGRAFG